MLPLGLPVSLLLVFLPAALVLLELVEAVGGLLDDADGDLPPPHEPPQE